MSFAITSSKAVAIRALGAICALIAVVPVEAQEQKSQVVSSAWRTVCSTEADDKWLCRMAKTVPTPNRQGVLMQMLITRDSGKEGTEARFVVPLAVYLPAGVEFTPDKGKRLKVSFRSCSQAGCIAPFAMNDALVAQLKEGNRLEVRFLMRDQNPVNVAIDLKGFADAYDRLSKQ